MFSVSSCETVKPRKATKKEKMPTRKAAKEAVGQNRARMSYCRRRKNSASSGEKRTKSEINGFKWALSARFWQLLDAS
jgi:glycerol-3-phosphate O-acyltransferase